MHEQWTARKESGEGNRRANAFFDQGTFVEIGAHLRRQNDENELEGLVAGYGAVEGRLVFAFFQDNRRMKGALDALYSRKLENLYALAIKNGAPVVGVFDSAGAVIYDGAASMAAYGALMKSVSRASGIIPQIAVVDGICAGSAAAVVSMFDFTVLAEENAKFYLSEYRENAEEVKGSAALTVKTEAEAFLSARTLLTLLPSNNAEGVVPDFTVVDDLNRLSTYAEGEISSLLSSLADGGECFELYPDYGKALFTGFLRIGGILSGVVAGNCKENKGRIGKEEARKAAKLVSFCDSFSIPLVTLVDSEGIDQKGGASLASELARLANAYAAAETPTVTVVVGKAYGMGFTLLGSKALGADMVFALPESSIGLLSPEASAAFVWNDRVSESVTREEIEAEWKETYASPKEAAYRGEVDDVIEPTELRQRIAASLQMLAAKATDIPARRHGVLPL